jgi:hypothetical protein
MKDVWRKSEREFFLHFLLLFLREGINEMGDRKKEGSECIPCPLTLSLVINNQIQMDKRD